MQISRHATKYSPPARGDLSTRNNESKDGINQDILSELTRPPERAKGLHESTNQKVDDPVNLLSKNKISVEWITVGCGMDTGMVAKQVT